jgi:formylmethanofuran dehydrogenase subunit E
MPNKPIRRQRPARKMKSDPATTICPRCGELMWYNSRIEEHVCENCSSPEDKKASTRCGDCGELMWRDANTHKYVCDNCTSP